ncbi:hypothetical protein [Ruegeria sp. Alg231-54]|uniref:hypothetical protein n=1 Tax=Ruegeria sp. Alg231-54 TaxID=1922221 RepID=UPI00131F4065|nr:hypothetical protein [Ruegeria sp. Alg231-54]
MAHVRLSGLGDVPRLGAAAEALLDALGEANTPGVSQAAQEGITVRALVAFAQEALPDLQRTTLLASATRVAERKLQGQVTAITRPAAKSPVAASEETLRCYAVACVRFLVQHGQMGKTKARDTVAAKLRATGYRVADTAVKNWETKWLPAQEIGPEHGPVVAEYSPSRTVQVIQDALGANYNPAIDDPVRLVAQELRKPVAVR